MIWLSFAFLFVLLITPVSSQNQAILTPSDVFAPNVTIRPLVPENDDAGIIVNNTTRLLSLDGMIIQYPEALAGIADILRYDEDTFYIRSGFDVWRYDTVSSSFMLLSSPCQGRGLNNPYISPLVQPWVYVSENGTTNLCNALTGEITPPLPEERALFRHSYTESGYDLQTMLLAWSPDHRYVLFTGYELEERHVILFSYDTVDGVFRELGIYAYLGMDDADFSRWFATEFVFSVTAMCEECPKVLYRADASVENSLIDVLGNTRLAYYLDNPPRYVIDYESSMTTTSCSDLTYDVTSGVVDVYRAWSYDRVVCRPEYGSFDGIGYYREMPGELSAGSGDIALASVIRYDMRKGEAVTLYRGEVEQIFWISEDEKYAVLLLDNNGLISDSPFDGESINQAFAYTTWSLVDLGSGETLYSTVNARVAFKDHYLDYDASKEHLGIFPVAEGVFVTNECLNTITNCDSMFSARIVLDENGLTHEQIDFNPVVPLPGHQYVVVNSDPDNPRAGRELYDAVTGELTPFVKPLLSDEYTVEADFNALGEFIVTLVAKAENQRDIQFQVEFSADGNPVVLVESEIALNIEDSVPANLITSTPSLTPTVTLTPTEALTQIITPTPASLCILTVLEGVNLRSLPDSDTDSRSVVVGSAAEAQRFIGVGRYQNEDEDFGWWKLESGEWLREDFTSENERCPFVPDLEESAPDFLFLTPTPTSTPTPTATFTPTLTPTPVPFCELEAIMGANLRHIPDSDGLQVGSVAEGFSLTAVGQYASTKDFFIWWKLDSGEWLREDFVSEETICANLRVIAPEDAEFVFLTPTPTGTSTPTVPPVMTATSTPQVSASCDLLVINGANLRAGPGVDYEKTGSAAVDFQLRATGKSFNTTEAFTWWRLDTGEWIREDFVREGEECNALPDAQP